MEDVKIIDLYFARNEDAICQTDATYGRKTKSVIICDSEHIILSGIVTEVIVSRLGKNQLLTPEEDRIDD